MERLLARLLQKELRLAREVELLKQQLASRYDYSLEILFKSVDDWNYKYIDQINLKRFLIKCGVLPNDGLLLAIIRRMDLDADAKLNMREFIDGVRPIENFTAKKFVAVSAASGKSRPKTAHVSSQGMMYNQVGRQNTMYQNGEIYADYMYDARSSPRPAAKKSTKAKKSILKKSRSRSRGGLQQSHGPPTSQNPGLGMTVTARSVEEQQQMEMEGKQGEDPMYGYAAYQPSKSQSSVAR